MARITAPTSKHRFRDAVEAVMGVLARSTPLTQLGVELGDIAEAVARVAVRAYYFAPDELDWPPRRSAATLRSASATRARPWRYCAKCREMRRPEYRERKLACPVCGDATRAKPPDLM